MKYLPYQWKKGGSEEGGFEETDLERRSREPGIGAPKDYPVFPPVASATHSSRVPIRTTAPHMEGM